MSRLSNIERSIERLRVITTAAIDERILDDAFAALEESVRVERAGVRPSVWQLIVQSKITKLAAAAVIVIAVLIGAELFIGPSEPTITAEQAEQKRIEVMAAASDIDGLVGMLSEGQFASKVLAAKYLGEIGDERALPELERLYLSAEEHLPDDYTENPFAEPIEKIKSRIEPEPPGDLVGAEPNKMALVNVNDGISVDVNSIAVNVSEAVVAEANEIVEANVPVETEGVLDFLVVHKDTNEPMEGVKLDIQIQREGPDDKWKAVTDEQGLCRIEVGDLKTKHVTIEVGKERFVPVTVQFRKGQEEPRINIPTSYALVLEPGIPFGGFIQNEQGGPIEAATVYMEAPGEKRTEIEYVSIDDHTEKTDANGFWRCDIMPAKLDNIQIRLAHPNYIDDDSYYARSVPAISQLRQMTSVMVMKSGVHLVGTVVDWTGQPIAKAGVKQGMEDRRVEGPRTETDAEGRFEFKATKPGTLLLTAQAQGYAPDLKEIMVRKGMRPLEFRLGPAQTIRGQVVDTNDRPIEDVDIRLQSWRGRRTFRWRTETDAAGYFEWNEAPKDEVYFRFAKKDYMPTRSLPLSSSVDEHIIVMYRALRIRGKVVAADNNEPIGEFKLIPGTKWRQDDTIRWDLGSAKTFAGGHHETRFDEPRYGYFVRVEAAGYAPAISRMLTEEEEEVVIDFVLHRGEKPSGTVYVADGEPAVSAEVALFRTGFFGTRVENGRFADKGEQDFVVTGPDGQFSLPPQAEKYLLVVLHDEGYAEITDDELAIDPNIFIEPWACVEGMLAVGGKTGPNEMIMMDYYKRYEPNLPWLSFGYRTQTDANGNFVMERVVPGKARVVHYFKLSGRRMTQSHAETVEVIAGETVSVTLGGEGRPVVGRFVLPADCNEPVNWSNAIVTLTLKLPGPPRPEDFNEMIEPEKQSWKNSWRQSEQGKAYAKMEWEKARSYAVTIEQDGTFSAEDVPAGAYKLQVTVGAPAATAWWYRAPIRSVGQTGFSGTLTYEFEVPDMNEGWSDEPFDLGELEVEKESGLKVGDPAPAFEAETFDGNSIKLADYKGKLVVATFWTASQTWATQRLLEIHQTCEAYRKYDQFVMIGVSLDSDIDAARKLIKDNELKWIHCYLSGKKKLTACKDYEIHSWPATFVIGPDGQILAKNATPLLLESMLAEALAAERE
jgi:peroxiredoxin